MVQSIQDVLTSSAVDHFVGREVELEQLVEALRSGAPLVTFVHGIGGIGKSSLLAAFAEAARKQGAPVISLDCREIEPSESGILDALQRATGRPLPKLADAGRRLREIGDPLLLILDGYEVFRLIDSWLRQAFIPSLGDNVRIVLAGREPPVTAWKTRPGWETLFRDIELGPLDDTAARALIQALGPVGDAPDRISRFARGNPLALRLAATAFMARPERQLEDIRSREIIPQLTQLYLEDIPDNRLRLALESTSVIRRVTQSILAVLLPEEAPQDVFERLARLPFVVRGSDGLIVHEIVRQAIADNLHAADPNRYHGYRYLAYRQYRRELQSVGPADAWRYIADFLYMMEEPVIREAFFPSDAQTYAIETAVADDHAAIVEISRRHEPPRAVELTERLLRRIPGAFRVLHDSVGRIQGYYLVLDPSTVSEADLGFDPVLKNWWLHLRQDPIPRDQRVLFLRRWLGEGEGELPSPAQAACWLDVKGDYVRMRRVLRRCYACAVEAARYAPVLDRLGFELKPELAARIGSSTYQTAVLDFGPQLFLGWLDRHVKTSLQLEEDILDVEARELVVGEKRIGLTPLEFGVISLLSEQEGKAVSRNTLLDRVWGRSYDGGSNVVDARIRDLRKKLGPLSNTIETVTGVGYRFRHPGH